jgi:hypothetical protein
VGGGERVELDQRLLELLLPDQAQASAVPLDADFFARGRLRRLWLDERRKVRHVRRDRQTLVDDLAIEPEYRLHVESPVRVFRPRELVAAGHLPRQCRSELFVGLQLLDLRARQGELAPQRSKLLLLLFVLHPKSGHLCVPGGLIGRTASL